MVLKAPLSAQIEITSNCNHLCGHCYNFWRYQQTGKKTTKEDQTLLPRILEKVIETEVFHVVLTGGEPLLYPTETSQYIKLLQKNNIAVGLNTNLSLLTSKAEKQLTDAGLTSVLTSLTSHDPETHHKITNTNNTHNKTLKAIQTLANKGYHIAVNMVVSQENYRHVYKTGNLAHQLGAKTFCATKITPSPAGGQAHLQQTLNKQQTQQMLEDLLRIEQETGISISTLNPIPLCFTEDIGRYRHILNKNCSAGKTSVGISNTGEVRACQHSDKSYGNILLEAIQDIWARMEEWRNQNLIPQICKNCEGLQECGGGCRESAKAHRGNRNKPDTLVTGKYNLKASEKEELLNKQMPLRISKNLRYREEAEGAVIYKTPREFAIINKPTFKIIKTLMGETFTIGQLEQCLKVPMQHTITQLHKRGILREENKKW
ncbi:MAG: radical SAM protein [archaeon]